MPTRVCICMNSISHEISVHSKEAFCVNLSAIIYYGNVDICGWIDSLRGLYVQSISHWAPANIGPYSQAIAVPCPLFNQMIVHLLQVQSTSHSTLVRLV
ncbi:unnamed protein product [Heterobilharzia americana]|nr:unnamed protein product [Heterobilharzia americana]